MSSAQPPPPPPPPAGYRARSFTVHKRGNAEHECEDAVARDDARGLFAAADGVSQALFSRDWATILVNRFRRDPFGRDDFDEWLRAARAEWKQTVYRRWREDWAGRHGQDLPYTLAVKAAAGSSATFAGLKIAGPGEPGG